MNCERDVKRALARAIREAGNMSRLQEKTGLPYSVINKLNNGHNQIRRMPLETLWRLFPELEMSFFRDERPGGVTIRNEGANAGSIRNQGPTIIHGDNHGDIRIGDTIGGAAEAHDDDGGQNCTVEELRKLVLNSEELSDGGKVRIMKILLEEKA